MLIKKDTRKHRNVCASNTIGSNSGNFSKQFERELWIWIVTLKGEHFSDHAHDSSTLIYHPSTCTDSESEGLLSRGALFLKVSVGGAAVDPGAGARRYSLPCLIWPMCRPSVCNAVTLCVLCQCLEKQQFRTGPTARLWEMFLVSVHLNKQ